MPLILCTVDYIPVTQKLEVPPTHTHPFLSSRASEKFGPERKRDLGKVQRARQKGSENHML